MIVRDFLDIIESLAPKDLALEWDNSGLQVGDPSAPVRRVALALDATSDVILQATKAKCQLLITHHPLIFKPVKRLTPNDPRTRPAFLAIAGGLAVISAHTNWDMVDVAQRLAEVMGLVDCRPLCLAGRNMLKLVVFVPGSHEEKVRRAAFAAGAGRIGNYPDCFFKAHGLGGFKVPLDGKPFLGEPGKEEIANEARLEIILPPEKRDEVAHAVKAAHPYEEPAFEFYGVTSTVPGLGAVGRWEKPLAPRELGAFLSERLKTPGLWGGAPPQGEVARVATLPGSGGGDFILEAKGAGADLYVTGEISHHDSLLAREVNLPVFLAGHFESEYPSLSRLAETITSAAAKLGRITVTVLGESPSIRHNL